MSDAHPIPPASQWALVGKTPATPVPPSTDPWAELRRQLRTCDPTLRYDILCEEFRRAYEKAQPRGWWRRLFTGREVFPNNDPVAQAMVQLAQRLFVEPDNKPSLLEIALIEMVATWKFDGKRRAQSAAECSEQVLQVLGKFGHDGIQNKLPKR